MKSIKLKTNLAAFTGRAKRCCYRLYSCTFKQTATHTAIGNAPAKKHVQFTSSQFKTTCYN